MPAELRLMVYKGTLPEGDIRLDTGHSGLCGHIVGKLVAGTWLCSGPHVQILGLTLSCQMIYSETLVLLYQSNRFQLMRNSAWAVQHCLTTQKYAQISRFGLIKRLHVDLFEAKYVSPREVRARKECLSLIVEHGTGLEELTITYWGRWGRDQFPLDKHAITWLGKLRGLKLLNIIDLLTVDSSERYPANSPMADRWNTYLKKVEVMEEVFRKFAYLPRDGDWLELDEESKKMTRSDGRFERGFRIQVAKALKEKHNLILA